MKTISYVLVACSLMLLASPLNAASDGYAQVKISPLPSEKQLNKILKKDADIIKRCALLESQMRETLAFIEQQDVDGELGQDAHDKHMAVLELHKDIVTDARKLKSAQSSVISSKEYKVKYYAEQLADYRAKKTGSRYSMAEAKQMSGKIALYKKEISEARQCVDMWNRIGAALDKSIQAYLSYLGAFVRVSSSPRLYDDANKVKKKTDPVRW